MRLASASGKHEILFRLLFHSGGRRFCPSLCSRTRAFRGLIYAAGRHLPYRLVQSHY
nr:MAG TPA: hypothetical protein [Caudoviricetes sp.]